MKATSLLEKQHRRTEDLIEELESRQKGDAALLTQLANELAAHMAIEQELFYPAARRVDHSLVLEGIEEHALAELALKRLLAADEEELFQARLKAMKELIEHHVKEEEKELFPQVEKALGDERLTELGGDMKARFEQLLEVGYDKIFPTGYRRTAADASKAAKAKAA